MIRRLGWAALAILGLAVPAASHGADKVRVLIVDGQNNHNWKAMTPPMKAALEGSGRFAVDVATSPDKDAPASAWDRFRPPFSNYDVVLSNYNGQPWPEAVKKDLESFVSGGGGLVVIHAANNAFPEWPEWNRMIGLGWRGSSYGDRVTIDDAGKLVRTPAGEGPGSGHGPQHAYQVVTRDSEHPVMNGLPAKWMHAKDELYHGQRGPARDMHILATAFSSTEQGGTGTNEPLVWVIPYGKGRVFTCLLGHAMGDDTTALRCAGFRTLMLRGTEWAATGSVTLPVPADFPTASEVRLSKEAGPPAGRDE